MQGVQQAASAVAKRVMVVADIVAFGTFHLACAAKEFAESGFGIPSQILNLTSLSVAGCAIAGHASLGFDIGAKVFGKKECGTCNGWEGIRCSSCRGTGEVQFLIVNPGLERGESLSVENVARAVVDGRAELQHVPGSMNFGLSLPSKQCTMCSGTGVMKCTECNGNSWKPRFTTEKLVGTSTKALGALKKMDATSEELKGTLENPATAEFLLFTRPELEGGLRLDDDVKKEIWWNYEEWKHQREMLKVASGKERGWENAQQALVTSDPVGALEDSTVVKNIPYYKARRAIEAEVEKMVVPPRPEDWTVPVKYPMKESAWSKDQLKDPKKHEEKQVLLQAQNAYFSDAFDATWEKEWRAQKTEELIQQKIESYLKSLSTPKMKPEKPVAAKATEATPKPSERKSQPAQATKEDKKRERKERAERLAKQAADREAALRKAKKKR